MNRVNQEVANKALENLEQTAQIKGKWKPIAQKKGDHGLDGLLEFTLNGKAYKVNAQVKNNIRAIHLPKLYELAENHAPLIVIADQIFPKIKEELRNHNIAYLETNGNIWLKHDKGLYWIDTNKVLPEEKEKINRAFTKTGLKVVFDILRDETLINLPYREIAKRAEIALGNINYIINGLKEKGFILKLNKNTYKLTNKQELLNTWITKYEEKLKPELEIGTFRFLKKDDFLHWKNLQLKNNKTWWGGEPGGDLYTNYLKPAVLTLYTTETRNELIRNYRLIPDPKGDVKVYRKFWTYDEVNDRMAPPLLIYADLINTGDHRCIETAQKLYHELFEGKF
jgi:hypothetical protein